MAKRPATIVHLLARLVCVVAVLSLGFAHRPPQLAAAIIETVALQLPDGRYADLCVGEKGTSIPGPYLARCEACLLSGSTLLPPPTDASFLIRGCASLENRPVETAILHAGLSVEQPRSRGPPHYS